MDPNVIDRINRWNEMWCNFPVEVVLVKVVIHWSWKKLDKAWKKRDCGQVLVLMKFERVLHYTTHSWHLFPGEYGKRL